MVGFSDSRQGDDDGECWSSCNLCSWSNVEDLIMMNFIIGVVFGVVVATAGFSGVANFADKQLESAKEVIKENVK